LRIAAGVLLAIAGLIVLVLVLGARDDPEVASPSGSSALEPDLGAEHSGAAQETDEPPTSGPHAPELVTRDRRRLTNDQLLHALELGNVVLLYDAPEPPPELVAVQRDVAGPFDAEVAAAGLAVILARWPGIEEPTAVAWRRVQRGAGLREFAEAWLGQGLGT
jgi:hypothetical protein